jgi:hypothetical protein
MTTETKLRGGLAMSLLGLTIMIFFYFQQQDELQRCKSGDGVLEGGDIEKDQLINRVDSLCHIVQEKVQPKEHFDGVTEMIIEDYCNDKFLNEDAKKDIDFVSKYTHQQRVEIVNKLKKLNETHLDWYTTLEVYRVTNPKEVEEIEKIKNHYTE